MSRRSAAALACLALSAPALAACGHSSTSADAAGTVKAVASTTQICDYITQLASGDASSNLSFDRTGADGKTQHFGADAAKATSHLTLTCLLAPNASAHEHDMTTAQSKALSEADLFFVSGVDLEHFLDSAVDSTGFKGTMVVTSGVAGAADVDDLAAQKKKEEAKPYKVDRGSAKVEVAKWPFPPEEGESEPEFRFDPHVWTSPKNAIVQVTNIGAALEKAAPDQAGVFRNHVDAYAAKLKAEAEKHIADFGAIKILKGRWGPYVTDGKTNARIPKDTDPTTLDEAQAREILAAAPPKRGRRKTAARTTTTRKKRTA